MRLNTYSGVNSNRGPSLSIWKSCPYEDIKKFMCGVIVEDDFVNAPNLSADADDCKYSSFIDTSATITGVPSLKGIGAIALDAANAMDNDAAVIGTGGNTGASFVVSDTTGDDFPLWFEVRYKVNQVGNNYNAALGLFEEGLVSSDGIFSDSDAQADKDAIAFRVLAADGDELDFVYNKASAGGITEHKDGIDVVVADTFAKAGFLYNPWSKDSRNRITTYIDGTLQSTRVTAAQIAAATFPDAEELAMYAAVKLGGTTRTILTLDWWRCAQMTEKWEFTIPG